VAWTRIISLEDCLLGQGVFAAVGGFELAVFRLGAPERIVVIDNACPHSSGNLSAGSVEGSVVTCPLHQWEFDLDRGVCTHSERVRVEGYRAEVRDGFVWADLPERRAV
jgi:nitrite reductase (NADH) small subunit